MGGLAPGGDRLNCCQADSQPSIQADRAGRSTKQVASSGQSWKVRPLLRI
jgi:hypothetical protein